MSNVNKCPYCGKRPEQVELDYLLGEPHLYRFSCCGIDSGYRKDRFSAIQKWNEAILLETNRRVFSGNLDWQGNPYQKKKNFWWL